MFAKVNIVWIAIKGKTDSEKTITKNELLFNKRL